MRAVVLYELNGEIHIGLAALALGLIEIDGLAVAGRFRDADGARDGGLVDLGAKILFDLIHHLQRQIEPPGEHGEHHTLDVQIGVVLLADGLEGADELRQALQCVILTLDGDKHAVAGAQTVQGEQIQAGRAVHKDEVVVLLHRGQRLAQAAFAARQIDHFQTRTRKPGVGTDDIGAELGLADGILCLRLTDQQLISTHIDTPLGNAVTGGGIALRVQIDDERLFAQSRNAGRKVHGRGGLAHAAFLVCNCNDFSHALCFLPGKLFVPRGTFEAGPRCFPTSKAPLKTSIAHQRGFLNLFPDYFA